MLRFMVSSSFYQWLGRDFPYGTLVVNVMGSLLLGLLTEALMHQRIAVSLDYRSAILIGFIGAFTTFSTFSLETFYLLESGQVAKAMANIFGSVSACLLAVWVGLLLGRLIYHYSSYQFTVADVGIPYTMPILNFMGALVIACLMELLFKKSLPLAESKAVIFILLAGAFITFSGLYWIVYMIERGHTFEVNLSIMLAVFIANTLLCLIAMWLGITLGMWLN